LVVVSIVGLAILLPSLSSARVQAKQVASASNMTVSIIRMAITATIMERWRRK